MSIKPAVPFHCPVGQGFGENFNNSYRGIGGHPGVDEYCGYSSDIFPYAEGEVIGLAYPDKEHPNRYSMIQLLCQTDLEYFEFTIGHVSEISVTIGQQVKKVDKVGEEGNFGRVFSGNVYVSEERRRNGSHAGSHRHVQKRPLYRVRNTKPGKRYVQTPEGLYRDKEGFYYEHVFPYSQYAGCVNWLLPLFKRHLTMGSTGYEVHLLQQAMKLNYLAMNYTPTSYFGPLTLTSVMKFQKRFGYTPAPGVGPKTRAVLNTKYHQL